VYITCISTLNVSGQTNLGPLFINRSNIGNTFLQIGTTGNILSVIGNNQTWIGCSENVTDSHITIFSGQGVYYRCSPNAQHLFGDTVPNNYLTLAQTGNYSNVPFTFGGAITCNGGVSGNLNISGFLTCNNRWFTLSNNFSFGSGSTYCAGFYLNNYPNLINGKTFLIDGAVTQSGLPNSTSYGFTQLINNPGTTSSGNIVVKNLYMSGNTVVNWYNAFTSWNDGLNVYTYGTNLPQLV